MNPLFQYRHLYEVSREAEAAGIMMGCLTNGYMTEESAEILASIFSFFNISLKGISDKFQQNVYRYRFIKTGIAEYQEACI